MNKKVVSFSDDSNRITEEQKNVIENMKKIVSSQQNNLLPDSMNDRILLKQTDRVFKMILEQHLLSRSECHKYLEITSKLLKQDQEEIFNYLDVATYTCMLEVSKKEILNLNIEMVQMMISILAEADIPVTSYQKCLNIWLRKEVLHTIETFRGMVPISHIITDLFYEMEGMQSNWINSNFMKRLNEEIENYLEASTKNVKEKFQLIENFDANELYLYLKESMDRLNQWTDFQLYTEKHYQILEKIHRVSWLSEEEYKIFLKRIQTILELDINLLEKIEKLLNCVDSSFRVTKEDNRFITLNFVERRK